MTVGVLLIKKCSGHFSLVMVIKLDSTPRGLLDENPKHNKTQSKLPGTRNIQFV